MNSLALLSDIDAVLLDLGGVLLYLEPERQLREMSALFGAEYRSYIEGRDGDASHQDFERGALSASEFRDALSRALGADPAQTEFESASSSIIGPFISANVETVARLRGKVRLFLLSNTNALHAPQFEAQFERECPSHGRFRNFFEFAHYSHELGARKPDAAAFQAVLDRHKLTASRVLFVDDNRANIDAAKALGIHTYFTVMNSALPDFESASRTE